MGFLAAFDCDSLPAIAMPPSAELVADKGYDSNALRQWLRQRGTEPVIPPRRNRKIQYECDKNIYKQRNVIERMFCRLRTGGASQPASTATSQTSWAPIAFAAVVIWWL